MKTLNQLLLDFDYDQNFKDDDFYVGKSNYYTFELINKWPKWEKNFLNISGEKLSGKTHLVNIFLKKFNGIKIESSLLNNDNLKIIKPFQNIVLEDLNLDVDEKLIYTLFNIIDTPAGPFAYVFVKNLVSPAGLSAASFCTYRISTNWICSSLNMLISCILAVQK